jgi:glycosyltransferase involved in cell wall biosynthesis
MKPLPPRSAGPADARTGRGRFAIVVKGYPRLSETFIAQEMLALQDMGFDFDIWSLRKPTDKAVHPMHRRITARRLYLPEYLYQGPLRVLAGALAALGEPGLRAMLAAFWRDLKRDPTTNRGRRLGQALVLARELDPAIRHIHVHYLHTPASVVRYAALLTGRTWSFSAHAKDIWTSPDWEKREKLADAQWGVTCTRAGHAALNTLAPHPDHVGLVYHGLDLSRFPDPPEARPPRDGTRTDDPVRIMSVGRAVAKKGYDDLLKALASLPADLAWTFVHVGGGELLDRFRKEAQALGLSQRIAFMGARTQPEIIDLMRQADIFVLPAKEAKSGDRDGLPNVVMEAASQDMAILATDFAGIPEFVRDDVEGWLVPPGDWTSLANRLNLLARDPGTRLRLGRAARARLVADFGMEAGIADLAARLNASLAQAASPTSETMR